MIDLRFIFIYLALFSFGLDSNSLAVEVSPQDNSLQLDRVIKIAQTDSPSPKENNSAQPVDQASTNSQNKPNKWLSFLGIVISSAIYLSILYFLLKPEAKLEDTEESPQLVEEEPNLKTIKPIREDNNSAEAKPPTEELPFPMIGMSWDEEFTYQPRSNSESLKPQELEVPKKSTEKADPTVNSDLLGKLTIVASETTEIDVVSELIKDLRNRSANPAENKELRRKAIWELGQTNDFRAVEPLVQIMPEVDSLEKNLILDAVTQITQRNLETINQVLLTSLEDDNADIRKNAIQDLTFLYQSAYTITNRLSTMTLDTDPEVQQTVRWALEQFQRLSSPLVSVKSQDN